jgi:uncharacterized C2H2 Zn-finger protein
MSNEKGSAEIKCNRCGITFATQQDKEEHLKLNIKKVNNLQVLYSYRQLILFSTV